VYSTALEAVGLDFGHHALGLKMVEGMSPEQLSILRRSLPAHCQGLHPETMGPTQIPHQVLLGKAVEVRTRSFLFFF
jgi:hypothetical protein